ncbi:hypothetical protein JOE36_004264 [Paenibacillus sp. PvP091]|nr:hypothetical protein [Paenibacillus sp. PvP091]
MMYDHAPIDGDTALTQKALKDHFGLKCFMLNNLSFSPHNWNAPY